MPFLPSFRALRLSVPAGQDLQKIADHTLQQWGSIQQQNYLNALQQALWLLCSEPKLGIARNDILQGIYLYPVGRHRIVYRITPRHLVVLRVLHQSMLVEKHIK
ncbi:type II toxin-antitoxin system RelE/ParE family toxin [Neptunicella sp. SCSIO 80796]|uniref:type II toxin-antitoxin system RelE/ParE family toxin n=1 Tax=Neptunicella plasticusilytica TaxID=3117012 RepID=UPI003A4D8542